MNELVTAEPTCMPSALLTDADAANMLSKVMLSIGEKCWLGLNRSPQQVLLYIVLNGRCASLHIFVIFQTWQNPHRPCRFCLCLAIHLGGCLRKMVSKDLL